MPSFAVIFIKVSPELEKSLHPRTWNDTNLTHSGGFTEGASKYMLSSKLNSFIELFRFGLLVQ